MRLLAAVPSVVYGLIGILVIVPWVGEHLISLERKESVANVVQLDGASLGVGILILTVMIVPIMIAIVVDALRAVPRSWTEGAAALGANRWRVTWTISVRTARPAIVAAAVLATARALGEAIMLSMVAGSASFAPNPIDGITFLFEPTRPLASALVENVEGLSVEPFGQTLVRLRRRPARLQHVPLAGWLRRQAADAQVRGAAMMTPARVATPPRDSVRSWPLRDRLGYFAAWGAGLTLIAIAGSIVVYMAFRGAQYFDLGLLFESPNATLNQAESGGFKDPLIGTALLLVMSTADRGAARGRRSRSG